MMELEAKKKQEIDVMVSVLMQLDLTGIHLLTRDANTLLALKIEKEREKELVLNADREGPEERKLA
ncbi:MAG: hypothetical protein LBN31_07535 [Hungatella sp.]|jgi:hypothetical protein|nr:hypothetical protein [Hungatella sp.]